MIWRLHEQEINMTIWYTIIMTHQNDDDNDYNEKMRLAKAKKKSPNQAKLPRIWPIQKENKKTVLCCFVACDTN